MKDQVKRTFFISIHEKDGVPHGHGHTLEEPKPVDAHKVETNKPEPTEVQKDGRLVASPRDTTFSNVIESFVSVMETYRDFVSFMLEIGPALSVQIAAQTIGEFAKQKGIERPDLAKDGRR